MSTPALPLRPSWRARESDGVPRAQTTYSVRTVQSRAMRTAGPCRVPRQSAGCLACSVLLHGGDRGTREDDRAQPRTARRISARSTVCGRPWPANAAGCGGRRTSEPSRSSTGSASPRRRWTTCSSPRSRPTRSEISRSSRARRSVCRSTAGPSDISPGAIRFPIPSRSQFPMGHSIGFSAAFPTRSSSCATRTRSFPAFVRSGSARATDPRWPSW